MQCLMLLAASCYRNREIPLGVLSFLWKIVYIWNVLVTSTGCITPRICFEFITKKGNKKRWWCIMMLWRGKIELMNLWWAIKKTDDAWKRKKWATCSSLFIARREKWSWRKRFEKLCDCWCFDATEKEARNIKQMNFHDSIIYVRLIICFQFQDFLISSNWQLNNCRSHKPSSDALLSCLHRAIKLEYRLSSGPLNFLRNET